MSKARVTFAFMEISTEDGATSNHYSTELSKEELEALASDARAGTQYHAVDTPRGIRLINLHACQYIDMETRP
jgi:hypothetical protein